MVCTFASSFRLCFFLSPGMAFLTAILRLQQRCVLYPPNVLLATEPPSPHNPQLSQHFSLCTATVAILHKETKQLFEKSATPLTPTKLYNAVTSARLPKNVINKKLSQSQKDKLWHLFTKRQLADRPLFAGHKHCTGGEGESKCFNPFSHLQPRASGYAFDYNKFKLQTVKWLSI